MEDCPLVEHAEATPAAPISIHFASNFLVEPQVPHTRGCQQHQSIADLLKVEEHISEHQTCSWWSQRDDSRASSSIDLDG